jgi:small subunit ribosomal protein S17
MSETNEITSETAGNAAASSVRTLTGRVVSNRMDKTAAISVERVVKHPLYGKYIRRTTKLLAHDEANECRIGDLVSIAESRPLSRRKAWKVVEIVERGPES